MVAVCFVLIEISTLCQKPCRPLRFQTSGRCPSSSRLVHPAIDHSTALNQARRPTPHAAHYTPKHTESATHTLKQPARTQQCCTRGSSARRGHTPHACGTQHPHQVGTQWQQPQATNTAFGCLAPTQSSTTPNRSFTQQQGSQLPLQQPQPCRLACAASRPPPGRPCSSSAPHGSRHTAVLSPRPAAALTARPARCTPGCCSRCQKASW